MLVNPEGPNPIAIITVNQVEKHFGYDGDYAVNQTVNGFRTYSRIYTLGDLYTNLVLADQRVVDHLDAGPVEDSSEDSKIMITPVKADLVFISKWPGLLRHSLNRTVTIPERREPHSRIDEIVSTFEIEFLKKGLRRRKIAGNIAYLL